MPQKSHCRPHIPARKPKCSTGRRGGLNQTAVKLLRNPEMGNESQATVISATSFLTPSKRVAQTTASEAFPGGGDRNKSSRRHKYRPDMGSGIHTSLGGNISGGTSSTTLRLAGRSGATHLYCSCNRPRVSEYFLLSPFREHSRETRSVPRTLRTQN